MTQDAQLAVKNTLQPDRLMEIAASHTKLDDFGDIPFREPLEVLLDALITEAKLEGGRVEEAANSIVGCLIKRLQLVNDRKQHNGIADEQIEAPIFIVGLPRTGSTILHALMGVVQGVRVPRFWELIMPSPAPESGSYDSDPRISQAQAIIEQMPTELLRRHTMAANQPEQCNMINDWSFMNQALLASYDIPSYRDWLYDADFSPAFETHRRTLQHLQWQNPGRWVLKYPKHLLTLEQLLLTYPDAKLIWTHRDPSSVIPSVCSLTGYMRSPTPGYDPLKFGREWTTLEEIILRRGLYVREHLEDADTRIHDLHFEDLMKDPVGSVGSICNKFNIPYSTDSQDNVAGFIADNPRTKHGKHSYTAEEFGLTREGLLRRFGFYVDRFGVLVK